MNRFWNRPFFLVKQLIILTACLLQLPSNTLTWHIDIECAVTGVSLYSFYSSDLNVTHLIRIYSWNYPFYKPSFKNLMVGLSPKVCTFINLSMKIQNGYCGISIVSWPKLFIQLEHASPEPISVFHSLSFPAQV